MSRRVLHRALLAILFAAAARAAEVRTTVSYVSAAAVYVGAGRTQGIAVGDSVEILRGESVIARLIVTFVADNSAACALTDDAAGIREGDGARIWIVAADLPAPAVSAAPPPETAMPETATRTAPARRANRVSGRAAIQYYTQDDHGRLNFDFDAPALLVRLRVENLYATRHNLSLRLRGRRTVRDPELSPETRSQWTGRVYELALEYDEPASKWSYSLGRVNSNRLRGIGSFDGGELRWRLREGTQIGGFGGTIPDARTTDLRGSHTRFGVFAEKESSLHGAGRLRATAAVAGEYADGRVGREFLYEQIDWSRGSRLWLLQSAELNMNRDWQRDAGAPAFQIANLLLNARFAARSNLAVNLAYDNRVTYRTWETRTSPDSLFDDSRRHGLRVGLDYRPVRPLRAGAVAGLRKGEGDRDATRTVAATLAYTDLPVRGVTPAIIFHAFHNPATSGSQPSAAISYTPTGGLMLSVQIGHSEYTYRTNAEAVANDWLRLRGDVLFGKSLFGSAYFESYRGDSPDLRRLFIELGVRI